MEKHFPIIFVVMNTLNQKLLRTLPTFTLVQASTETDIPVLGSFLISLHFESSSTAQKKLPPSLELLLRHIP